VPSFNELCGGTPVNDVKAKLLGPLAKPDVVNLDRARLHLLDGTDLGTLPALRVEARFRWSDYRQ
jgi:metallophosphoesterase superfamily enzyme